MSDGNVYYCWSCDAHRRTITSASQRLICTHCSEELTPDALVSTPMQPTGLGSVLLQLTSARSRDKAASVASPAA